MKISFLIIFFSFLNALPGFAQKDCLKKEKLKDDFVMLGSTNATQKITNICPTSVTVTYEWNGDFLEKASDYDKEGGQLFLMPGKSGQMTAWEIKKGTGSFHISFVDVEPDPYAISSNSSYEDQELQSDEYNQTDIDFSEFIEEISDNTSFPGVEPDTNEEEEYLSNELSGQHEKIITESDKTENSSEFEVINKTEREIADGESKDANPKYNSSVCNNLVQEYQGILSSYKQLIRNIQDNPTDINHGRFDSFSKRIAGFTNRCIQLETNNQLSEECNNRLDKLFEEFTNAIMGLMENVDNNYNNNNNSALPKFNFAPPQKTPNFKTKGTPSLEGQKFERGNMNSLNGSGVIQE